MFLCVMKALETEFGVPENNLDSFKPLVCNLRKQWYLLKICRRKAVDLQSLGEGCKLLLGCL